ncbi:Werner syndrome ATP-dependent helicase-like [Dorcoceras hygrometricum]|uniref:Werner syndrome ATP-dependent helicase-like n=1 Tax=Dorcoceras hygrometricum TaxID=472368 RepID=A0A2Z6ZUY3_9LAMI|nr:Werner syndrome ATP-dependent helicase-like [Dorcoceras hygrometricum]
MPPHAAAPCQAPSRELDARWPRSCRASDGRACAPVAHRGRCVERRCALAGRIVAPTSGALAAMRSADDGRRLSRLFSRCRACVALLVGRCTLLECDACGGWSCVMRAGRAASCAAVRNFSLAAAAGRPPLRRVSGDVVTADLNSYRVWFGPVPGSP